MAHTPYNPKNTSRSFGNKRNSKDDKSRNSFRGKRDRRPREKAEFESKMLDIARVTRVTKGGKRFSFRATVVIGDGKGMTGVGVAQGRDVQQAMQKATQNARKTSIKVTTINGTIPHEILHKYHGALILLKPAAKGSGVKAGGPVRVVARLSGIENITAKLIKRTNNKTNIARATIGALSKLKINNEKSKVEKPDIDQKDTKEVSQSET
jgi:small subunit ribosomal protein S5